MKALFGVILVVVASAANAVNITTSVDLVTPSNDQVLDLDLSRLLPIATNNTWTYNLYDFNSNPSGLPTKTVVAEIGQRETIGGGCLQLNPVVFGDELTLYFGNYGDSLSLYGIYLEHWMGMNDVLLKFETRSRVEWMDFMNLFINEQITPVDPNSCQDTGRGLVERTGLVLLEDLTENLGVPTNQTGEINCKPKNSDLRDVFVNGGQHGSGLATIGSQPRPLYWNVDSIVLTDLGGGDVQIQMDFRPRLGGSSTDYSMYIDMTLRVDQGITNLSINRSNFGVPANSLSNGDLIYVQTAANHVSPTNSIVPRGTCPEEGRLPLFISLLLLMSALIKRKKV